jgi:transcription factor IIIB subunit 2
MVSLSGEAGNPIPKPNALSSILAARFGGTARSIADRVREIERLIEDWRCELPWARTDLPTNSRKRTTKIAGWIKDVIRFKDDLWSKQVDAIEHALYSPSTGDGSDEEGEDNSSYAGSCSMAGSKHSSSGTHSTSSSKRRYLDAGFYDSGRPRAYVVESSKSRPYSQTISLAALLNSAAIPSTSVPSELDSMLRKLKRRSDIADEDLFEDDELEGLIRSNSEVETLRTRWEDERRFEGIPEWTADLRETPADMLVLNESGTCTDHGAEEVIGEWRDMSPSGFGDNDSYFYDD